MTIDSSISARPGLVLGNTNIIIFDFFASLGIVSILVVLIPALFSPRIRRSATWFVVLVSWLVYSVSYILLFGRQTSSKPPPLGLCLFQAVLVYATPPLCAAATTCFTIDFFLKLLIVKLRGQKIGRKSRKLLISLPWALGLIISGEAILVVDDAKAVVPDPNLFYCHIERSVPTTTNVAIMILCGLIIIPLEVYTGILLYRNWTVFKRSNGGHARIALSTLIRLALFSLVVSIAIVLSLFTATNMGNFAPPWSVVLMTMPTFSALCFGTQRDILGVWQFWKRPPRQGTSSKFSDTGTQCPVDLEGNIVRPSAEAFIVT
ncbi:hypothetical protein BDZ94DRAFT_1321394 [Collybia nuda]|uniref:Uncharacterized protein n=1 Tax=Collybia nuda TaxID=64659 RepID=A0A9P5Y8D4_9AGAR|nr:hypothetical protein BDZ94DRAFT_1321394 [Collybia nuda]